MFRRTTFWLISNSLIGKSLFLFSVLPVCLSAQSGYGQNTNPENPPPATILESGKPVERELSGGQKQSYQISLSANQYAGIIVEQRGIDVVARLFSADGQLISEFDEEIRTQGKETVEIVASAAGSYRLQIEAKLKSAPVSRYEIRFAELRAATETDQALQQAKTLFTESLNLYRAGKYKEALPPAERALEIRERVLEPQNIAVAAVLNHLGKIVSDLDDYGKAEIFYRRALDIYQKQLGLDALDAAGPLNNLALLSEDRGEFAEAEAMFRHVLTIREKELGPDHTLVAAVLNNLGRLYRKRGDNAKAQRMYERSLEIRERTLGKDHTDVASVLANLSSLYYYKGDYETTLKLDLRVLEIREKNLDAAHPQIARALNNLGLVYSENGEPDKAEPLYRRALEIYEKRLGRESLESASVLNNLGRLFYLQGDYPKAVPFFQGALQIAEKNPTGDVESLTLYLNNLGALYTLKGDYEQAATLLNRALEIREKTEGGEHFNVGRTCDTLARLYALKGDAAQALAFQERANRINEKNIALNLAIGTEHQKLSYMSLMWESSNQTISLHARLAQDNKVAREQAMTSILQRKGRVLDAMADSLAALRRRFDPQDQILFDRLNDTNARLAEFTLGGPRRMTLAEHQKLIAAIQEQKDRLETEISRRSAGFYESPRPVTLAAVKALIPADAALIEFAVYRPLEVTAGKSGKSLYGEPRYVVYVVGNQGETRWAELGPAKELEASVEAFRQALRDPKRQDVQARARGLDEKLMQPVRALLDGKKKLLISPDGDLNLMPFEALVDEQGNYLIENYSFSYLTSGRDLLRMQTARAGNGKPLVIADPSFGEPFTEQIAKANLTRKPNGNTRKRQSLTSTGDLSEVYFAPLGGTAQEARAIQTLFPEAVFLTGAQATESALKQTSSPRILHIATHGFFLQDIEIPFNKDLASGNLNAKIKNPLLRSGLALAGANRRSDTGNDGILTALEASGLNLWGTKLVVLSACDTGLGEVRNGEGVYGLRRAFLLAGTESLVMSLWPVSDQVTRELMTNYYKNLKQGMGRGAALRAIQLDFMKRPQREHPFYWASFIQSGEWANLDGKRETK